MSFVTFSQRTLISTTRKTRNGVSRALQVSAHRTMAAMQEILCEQVLWKRQQNRFRLTHADPVRVCRVFHKCMRKIGIEIPVRKTRQHVSGVVSFYKAKVSELSGSNARRSLSKPNLQAVALYMPEPKTGVHSFDLHTNTHPDTLGELGILESSLRFVDLLPSNTRTQPSLSMSCCRYATNIPTLQRHISFTIPTHKSSDNCILLDALFPIDPCPTPITPLDKIIHTPLYPPSLNRPIMKSTPSGVHVETAEDSAPYLHSTSRYFTPGSSLVSKVSENIRRRLSVVSPPEAKPMHAPRRLSYSHTYGQTRSPLRRRATATSTELLNSCAETSDLLASPLVIISSSSNKQLDSAAWINNSRYGADFSFSLGGSPIAMKV